MQLRFKDELEITSNTGYHDIDGEWVGEANPIPTTIKCNIQPLRKTADAQKLPRGRVAQYSFIVYTQNQINVADTTRDQNGDTTFIDGEEYEAVYSEKWRHLRLAHYKVLFSRKNVKENSI